MNQLSDWFFHTFLRRPYQAACTIDEGSGSTVVLLHGLASTGQEWRQVADLLKGKHRVIALDLLGFGIAPKPSNIDYTTEDHARAVLAALEQRKVVGSITLVGHSMGCLIALYIARTRPGLVRHLVLHELPLYSENPALRRHAMLQRVYFALYNRVLKYPQYSPKNARMVQRLAARIAGFEITKQTWTPFVKSLKNTVMNQTAIGDITHLNLPIDVIFGSRDIVVRPGMVQAAFGKESVHVVIHTVQAHHTISLEASECISDIVNGVPTKKLYIRAKPKKEKEPATPKRR